MKWLWSKLSCNIYGIHSCATLWKKLGFRTPRAQEVVCSGVDHHGSRQILSAAFMALSLELLVLYVRYCRGKSEVPTDSGYFSWVASEVKDSVYLFLFDMCWTFLFAFALYTEAIRKNNHVNMLAAHCAFCPLFYGRHHPKHQEIHLRDMCGKVSYPQILQIIWRIQNHSP